MGINVSKSMHTKIANAPKGIVPAGVNVVKSVAKTVTSKKDYVSTKGPNYGNTYTRYGGVVSVLKQSATPASTKQANKQAQAARVAAKKKP